MTIIPQLGSRTNLENWIRPVSPYPPISNAQDGAGEQPFSILSTRIGRFDRGLIDNIVDWLGTQAVKE